MSINLTGFLFALLPVALTPGASFTLVMSSALTGGYQRLFRTLAGTALGIYTHAILIGIGITALLVSSPEMYVLLNIVGNFYLLCLAGWLIRSGTGDQRQTLPKACGSVSVTQAWLANIANPKAIAFYLTVVSQFAGREGGVGHYLLLASLHIVVMSLWLLAVSYILIFSLKKYDPRRLKRYINISGGIVLALFSLHNLIQLLQKYL